MSKALVVSYPKCIMFEVMRACELIGKTHTIELASVDGHIDFAVHLARACGAIADDTRAESYRAFYRGKRLPEPARAYPA